MGVQNSARTVQNVFCVCHENRVQEWSKSEKNFSHLIFGFSFENFFEIILK